MDQIAVTRKTGHSRVRSIWLRNDLETMKKRL